MDLTYFVFLCEGFKQIHYFGFIMVDMTYGSYILIDRMKRKKGNVAFSKSYKYHYYGENESIKTCTIESNECIS